MFERDDFETRFAAAYRRYLDEAPTEVDASAVARAAAANPAGRLGAWPWTLRQSRTLVWIALLTLLLAALWGTALFAGAERLAPSGFTCPPGSLPDSPGPVDQARPPVSEPVTMAFDSRAGRIVTLTTSGSTWTFDVCTNTWAQMHPDSTPGGALPLAYDARSDLTVGISGLQGVWTYDVKADEWTAKRPVPFVVSSPIHVAYDSSSGIVLAHVSTSPGDQSVAWELWSYNVEADAWAQLREAGAPDGARPADGVIVHDPSVDRLVMYTQPFTPSATGPGNGETWRFDMRTGAWSESIAPAPAVNFGYGPWGPEIAYDKAAGRTVVFGDGEVIAYDTTADRWDTLFSDPDHDPASGLPTGVTARLNHSIVYDSVNERLIVYGGSYRTSSPDSAWISADDVLAFDISTRKWTVLLAPSIIRPDQ